jgi:predicted O-methyltransferase YrrM
MNLRKLAKDYYDKSIGLVGSSEEPYGSHVSVLVQIAQSLRPHRIAEFGMGRFSTSVFLDRTVFPFVEKLTSFEDDPEWFSVITREHPPNSQFEANLVSSPMWKTALRLRASDYDLIFVDDSKNQRDRSKTLLALRLAKGITKGPVVVVHDVELPRLRAMTMLFPRRRYFRSLRPQTGVLCWKPHPEGSVVLTSLEAGR